jgi:hypothetical protein
VRRAGDAVAAVQTQSQVRRGAGVNRSNPQFF